MGEDKNKEWQMPKWLSPGVVIVLLSGGGILGKTGSVIGAIGGMVALSIHFRWSYKKGTAEMAVRNNNRLKAKREAGQYKTAPRQTVACLEAG